MTWSITGIVDEIRAAVTLPADWQRDATCAPPAKRSSKTLYLWPDREVREPDGTGVWDLGRFTLGMELVYAPLEDPNMQSRLREVSTVLATAAEAVATWVLGNRAGSTYEQLQIDEVRYDMTRDGARGVALVLRGYRLVTS
jgi:hypothetical protein